MIRVFITDDHPVLREGLVSMLAAEAGFEMAGVAAGGSETLARIGEAQADVLLLDINLRDMSGIEVARQVREKHPEVRILALTMYDKGSYIQQMLRQGALGYVLKNAGKNEILEAIRTVHRGKLYLDRQVSDSLMNNLRNIRSGGPSEVTDLTRREKEVLRLIVGEYTTQEISEKLFISLNTVESHRKNLLSKLNARNSAGLVRIALEKGLLDDD